MRDFLDPSIATDDLPDICEPLTRSWYGYDVAVTRRGLLGAQPGDPAARPFDPTRIRRLVMKPFDILHPYVEDAGNLWVAPQPQLVSHAGAGASFLYVRRTTEAADDGAPVYLSAHLGEQHALHKTAYLIPTLLGATVGRRAPAVQETLALDEDQTTWQPNFSVAAIAYAQALGFAPQLHREDAEAVWLHALAVIFAPMYGVQNRDMLRNAYPRVPLPATQTALQARTLLHGRRGIRGWWDRRGSRDWLPPRRALSTSAHWWRIRWSACRAACR
jgi:hypothetical protein